MKNKPTLSNSLRYGGVSKNEFELIRPIMLARNLKSWRMMSVVLEFFFIAIFVVLMLIPTFRETNAPYYFGALALYDLLLTIILFFAIDKNRNIKLILPVIHVSLFLILSTLLAACTFGIKGHNEMHVLFWAFFIATLVFTIDKPYRMLLVILFYSVAYCLCCGFADNIAANSNPDQLRELVVLDVFIGGIFFIISAFIYLYMNITAINQMITIFKAEKDRDVDALTGVKNYLSYERVVEKLSIVIKEKQDFEFAVAIFDINDLKSMNDNYGHKHGDELIVKAAKIICDAFKHSPVYRIGGDEFVSILFDEDYNNREAIADSLKKQLTDIHQNTKDPVDDVSFAFGIASYQKDKDEDFASVFSKADADMYKNKRLVKLKRTIEL